MWKRSLAIRFRSGRRGPMTFVSFPSTPAIHRRGEPRRSGGSTDGLFGGLIRWCPLVEMLRRTAYTTGSRQAYKSRAKTGMSLTAPGNPACPIGSRNPPARPSGRRLRPSSPNGLRSQSRELSPVSTQGNESRITPATSRPERRSLSINFCCGLVSARTSHCPRTSLRRRRCG
jgi:hypothetical protein